MTSYFLRKVRSMKNSFEVLQDTLDDTRSEDSASITIVQSTQSSSLSSLIPSDPPPASPSPILTQPPLFSTPIQQPSSNKDTSLPIFSPTQPPTTRPSLISTPDASPIHTSTPSASLLLPSTQSFKNRADQLRNVDDLLGASKEDQRGETETFPSGARPKEKPPSNDKSLSESIEELRSELTAVRLQLAEHQLEINQL